MATRSPLLATGLVAFLFSAGLFGGAWAGNAAANRLRGPYEQLELFARILSIIEQDYVEERNPSILVGDAIEGMVNELDPHSTWMNPEEYQSLLNDTQGEYEGIGVEVRRVEAGIFIARVLDNSPAAAAGLRPKDIIVAIDGTNVIGLPIDDVSRKLKGPRGTQVVLTIVREGETEPLQFTSTRDRVEIVAVFKAGLPGGIAYTRLIQFQRGCAEELEHAILDLRASGHDKGLILDLRDNPGGLLDESIAVSDLFLKDGIIVSTNSRIEGESVFKATPKGIPGGFPMAILVNGMSASASEIVAGALQDRKRARLIGTRTYGKGSVQTLYENSDKSALKLTIGRYYTPSGAPVAPLEGRLPDDIVSLVQSQTAKQELTEAISGLASIDDDTRTTMLALLMQLEAVETELDVPWTGTMQERLQADPQLRRALEWFKTR